MRAGPSTEVDGAVAVGLGAVGVAAGVVLSAKVDRAVAAGLDTAGGASGSSELHPIAASNNTELAVARISLYFVLAARLI